MINKIMHLKLQITLVLIISPLYAQIDFRQFFPDDLDNFWTYAYYEEWAASEPVWQFFDVWIEQKIILDDREYIQLSGNGDWESVIWPSLFSIDSTTGQVFTWYSSGGETLLYDLNATFGDTLESGWVYSGEDCSGGIYYTGIEPEMCRGFRLAGYFNYLKMAYGYGFYTLSNGYIEEADLIGGMINVDFPWFSRHLLR
jgi:hypothetical protein